MSLVAQARTLLFVPGNRADRFAKAAASGADGVLCDLEDAVAPADKPQARSSVIDGLSQTPAVVRINAVGTPWHADDLAAVRDADGVLGVLLPKADTVGAVEDVARALDGRIDLLVQIESALGVQNADRIAQIPGVTRMCFGNLDFALDAGLEVLSDLEDELLYARSVINVASRAAGLPGPLDGIVADFQDDQLLTRRTARSLSLGYTGRLLIHPRQVAPVHAALEPTPEQVQWATRIMDAAGDTDGTAVQIDGQMVDRPVLLRAQSILSRVGARESS